MPLPLASPALTALLLAGLLGPARAYEQDVRGALGQLEAPQAAQRLAAERWLAEHLRPSDLATLGERLPSASLEARRRLEVALGGDERHLELALLLAADRDPATRGLGEATLRRLVAGWLGGDGLDPAPGMRVLGALAQRGAASYRFAPTSGALQPLFERIVRLAGREVGRRGPAERLDVALDPRAARGSFEPVVSRAGGSSAEPVDGDFLTLLFHVAGVQGLEVEGFGLDDRGGRNAWLHVTARGQARRSQADDLILTWARTLLAPGDPVGRVDAARALAGTGWSAVLTWLERRWAEQGDGAALEGLLLAAARGKVVPSLATRASVERLLRIADDALLGRDPAADRRADRVRFALGALPPFGADAGDLGQLVAARLGELPPRSRFLRLSVLASMGSLPAAERANLRQALGASGTTEAPEVELEALRALAASRPWLEEEPWSRLARASALLELATRRGQEGALLEWMRAAHVGPPEAWRRPRDLPPAWDPWQRLLVAEAWLAAPAETATARAHLSALGAGVVDPRVERRLRRIVAGPLRPTLREALLQGSGAGAGTLARLALVAGILPGEAQAELLGRIAPGGVVAADDAILLGPLAVGPVGDQARAALLDAVRGAAGEPPAGAPDQAPWARAFERAWGDLVSAGRDQDARVLRTSVAELLRAQRHPLAVDMVRQRWPRGASEEVLPLAELESPLPSP